MFRIALCEDMPGDIKNITSLMNEYQIERPGIEISQHCFINGNELLASINNGESYDLFLLDIMLPEQSGMELAKVLRMHEADTPLVFLTFSPDYAFDAFSVNASQYMLKPVTKEVLFPVLDRIIAKRQRESEKYFIFSTPSRIVRVLYSSIVCIESFNRTMRLYLTDGSVLSSKTIRAPFTKATEFLLQDPRFLCAHKSFVLNMAHITELTGRSFKLICDVEVPIPRYKYAEAKSRYFDWLSTQDYSCR